jgi:hypothetical protein
MTERQNGTQRTDVELADERDLRSVIAAALATTPVDQESLRRGVWTYVGAERNAGAPAGHVIVTLTELVEEAMLEPASVREPLTRRVILWCVEAYFGHLGGEVLGRDRDAFSDAPVNVSNR